MAFDEQRIRPLSEALRGRVLTENTAGYDEARKVFNAMIDRRPALIVQCADAGDVVAALDFANGHGLSVAVRAGGHGVTGNAVCDDGLVVDLSGMRGVRVDPERARARADGGATWGDFDHATQAFGLATTGGIVPSTGVAGLTLGGGIGYLNRKHGLSCDNLVSADVVTADGQLLTANASENADLFWALRGGGGNFGVVTSLEYQVHPVGPVLGGELVFPLERAKEVLRLYRDWSTGAPDELRADATLISGPQGAALAIIVCYCGASLDQGESLVRSLRQAQPMVDTVAAVPYTVVQNLLTDVLVPGMHHYWKSGFLESFSDEAVDSLVDFFRDSAPGPLAAVAIEHLGGAVARVGSTDTAFAHRQAEHSLLVLRAWDDPAQSEANLAWGRRCYAVAEPFLERGVYVNYLGEEGDARVRAAYGPNYDRLAAIKAQYDPTNLFRLNQNIAPRRAESPNQSMPASR